MYANPKDSLGKASSQGVLWPLGRITNLDLRIMPQTKKKGVFASQTEDYYLDENNRLVFTGTICSSVAIAVKMVVGIALMVLKNDIYF